jgi:hypothetical protein
VRESALDRFLQLSVELRQEIADRDVSYDTLLKKHKACVRTTFADPAHFVAEIDALTAAINARMQQVRTRLASPDSPDSECVVVNLRAAEGERFREFAAMFNLEQQSFSAKPGTASYEQTATVAEFAPIHCSGTRRSSRGSCGRRRRSGTSSSISRT